MKEPYTYHTAPKLSVQDYNSNPKNAPAPKKKRVLRYLLLSIVFVILALGSIIVVRAVNIGNKIFVGQKSSIFSRVSDLLKGATGSTRLVGEDLGQINILLLGIGGEGHDGPYLSDTIMLAQIRPDLQKISIVSLPRDYLVSLPNGLGERKINSAFAEGFNQNKDYNQAGEWARQTVEKVSGVKIPYFAVVDFQGFKEALDLVGGVDVNVERTFTDYTYPDEKDGYLPPVTFTQGPTHLNGDRALIYARSRHAAGPEGSDFARSQRQQIVMSALKDKVQQLNLITDSGKLNSLLSVVGNHFHTNITPSEMFRLYTLGKEYNRDSVISLSLDPVTKLICPQILESNGAYVLTPCPGKKASDIQDFFKNSFTTGRAQSENAIVWLADSTKNPAFYKAAQKTLEDQGVTVYQVGYSGPTLEQTVVYTVNDKPGTSDVIKASLSGTDVSLPPPGIKIDQAKVDLVVVLGGEPTIPINNTDTAPTPTPKTKTTPAPVPTPTPTTSKTPL